MKNRSLYLLYRLGVLLVGALMGPATLSAEPILGRVAYYQDHPLILMGGEEYTLRLSDFDYNTRLFIQRNLNGKRVWVSAQWEDQSVKFQEQNYLAITHPSGSRLKLYPNFVQARGKITLEKTMINGHPYYQAFLEIPKSSEEALFEVKLVGASPEFTEVLNAFVVQASNEYENPHFDVTATFTKDGKLAVKRLTPVADEKLPHEDIPRATQGLPVLTPRPVLAMGRLQRIPDHSAWERTQYWSLDYFPGYQEVFVPNRAVPIKQYEGRTVIVDGVRMKNALVMGSYHRVLLPEIFSCQEMFPSKVEGFN